jgi:hypothetical protein
LNRKKAKEVKQKVFEPFQRNETTLNEDMRYCKSLNILPTLYNLEKMTPSRKDALYISRELLSCYKKHGLLNFPLLIKDGLLTVERDASNNN